MWDMWLHWVPFSALVWIRGQEKCKGGPRIASRPPVFVGQSIPNCDPSCFTPLFPLPTTEGERHCVFGLLGGLSVRSRATISLYSVERFPWNLAQIFIMRVCIAEEVFKVRDQRSGLMHFYGIWNPLTAVRPLSVRRRHADRRRGVEAHLLSIARFDPKIFKNKPFIVLWQP